MELKPHQEANASLALSILQRFGWVYIAGEVRTGKTLTALRVCAYVARDRPVLCITKKNAIGGIEKGYKELHEDYGAQFKLITTNYESTYSLIKKDDQKKGEPEWIVRPEMLQDWSVIIIDESHSVGGAYPKPSLRAKVLEKIIKPGTLVIFLSGTPHPESWSQLYHQFWILGENSPWKEYKNFYKWAADYVVVKKRMINGYNINDYSRGIEDKIWSDVKDGFITVSQSDAGIEHKTIEHFLYVPMKETTYGLIETLISKAGTTLKNGKQILCDTPAKMQSKLHQVFSGTVRDEEDNAYIIDRSKAEFIAEHFAGKKIAIFYKFDAEGAMLRHQFPNHTNVDKDFNADPDKTFICQVVSGREGTDLSSADALVMFNIDFSAVSYFQAKDRMVNLERKEAVNLYWIFSAPAIKLNKDFPSMEELVYAAVSKKKSYTTRYFEKDFLKNKQHKLRI